jgi:hypothetical protein
MYVLSGQSLHTPFVAMVTPEMNCPISQLDCKLHEDCRWDAKLMKREPVWHAVHVLAATSDVVKYVPAPHISCTSQAVFWWPAEPIQVFSSQAEHSRLTPDAEVPATVITLSALIF